MSEYKRLTTKDKDGNWQVWEDDYSHPFEALQVAIDRLAEYEDDEENGKIVRLPCKVGDKVYVIADGVWHCQEVWQFRYDSYGLFVKTVGVYPYDFEWGETAFLTREEAEKKLKGKQE
jgi:hypothetical protein